MKRSTVSKTVYSALFAALVFVGTQFIRIPLVIGYFNLGDTFVLSAGYLIGGIYGVAASAIGSVLADILSGYIIYAPATLVIKSSMALIVYALCRHGKRRQMSSSHIRYILAATVAEAVMVMGYALYDTVIYGFGGALAALPANLMQSVIAVAASSVIIFALKKAAR